MVIFHFAKLARNYQRVRFSEDWTGTVIGLLCGLYGVFDNLKDHPKKWWVADHTPVVNFHPARYFSVLTEHVRVVQQKLMDCYKYGLHKKNKFLIAINHIFPILWLPSKMVSSLWEESRVQVEVHPSGWPIHQCGKTNRVIIAYVDMMYIYVYMM